MRILHIDTGRELRGGQWQVLLLIEALRAEGCESELFARPGSPLEKAAADRGIPTFDPKSTHSRPDVIHAHDARAHTSALVRLAGPPLVVSRRVALPVK